MDGSERSRSVGDPGLDALINVFLHTASHEMECLPRSDPIV